MEFEYIVDLGAAGEVEIEVEVPSSIIDEIREDYMHMDSVIVGDFDTLREAMSKIVSWAGDNGEWDHVVEAALKAIGVEGVLAAIGDDVLLKYLKEKASE